MTMSPKTKPFVPTLLLVMISIILINFPMATMSDNPCAYPCYPPPTGTTTTPTPVTTTPPQPTTSTTYPPPAYPTPTGYYPYNPPPSTYNGGGGYGYGPPPPDPILPYFPFYYKHGAHGDASSATSSHLTRSTLMAIATATNLLVPYIRWQEGQDYSTPSNCTTIVSVQLQFIHGLLQGPL